VTLAIKHDLGSLLLACERDHVRFGFYAAPRRPASIHNTVFELRSTPHNAVKTPVSSSRGLQHCNGHIITPRLMQFWAEAPEPAMLHSIIQTPGPPCTGCRHGV